ncbi:protein lifeguard 1-like [Cimex lectularius]|uniref:Protein lifeguard 1 n=1 Tax=Cimex lectularius TaxID=79782 RepID=A0A8I6TGK2_CIMLE|nr:protein lifeguard 1-like [Cimex lectularius]XP_014248305.1 protein lifeguard 1-like [Cimex lectularius]XP_014248306.1 protein lifeguard 1-like [Cimex lectularius]
MAWQQGQAYPGQTYPGQGQPPPPGFYPDGGYPPGSAGYPQQPGGYPPPGGYPQPGGYQPPGGYSHMGGFPSSGDPGIGKFASPGGDGGEYGGQNPLPQFDFDDKMIRLGFIRKVYSILFLQLAVTLGFITLFTFHEGTKRFILANRGLSWVALIVLFVCLIAMSCCGDVRRKAPMNFILLGIFTLAQSFSLGCIVVVYSRDEVMLAVGICTAVTLALSIFAFQTKIDFTAMGSVLFVSVIILMIFGIVLMFWHGKIATIVYGCLGALIFSLYIIYDTQKMIGKNHKYAISPEEYIFAALSLYLDIINLFLYILTIIGASRD